MMPVLACRVIQFASCLVAITGFAWNHDALGTCIAAVTAAATACGVWLTAGDVE